MTQLNRKVPDTPERLLEAYRAEWQAYSQGGGLAALKRAEELGRQVAASGRNVLETAAIHHQAMATILFGVLSGEKAAAEDELDSLARFCASCPAWQSATGEQPDLAKHLQDFFATSLSKVVSDQRGLRKANHALRRQNEVREQEKARISRALHAEAGQLLACVHLALEELDSDLEPPQPDRIREVRALLDGVEEQLRRLSHELRPPVLDDHGLVAALQFLARGVSKRSGVSVKVEEPAGPSLPRIVELTFYRFVQEALNNVTKHSGASCGTIQLRQTERTACCSVEDDGVGFQVAEALARKGERGIGLAGLREQLEALDGTLTISSSLGEGTRLVATVPLGTGELGDQLEQNHEESCAS